MKLEQIPILKVLNEFREDFKETLKELDKAINKKAP